ncbi:hypothetical protein CDAR_57271 [Caerostris darwini]|uniref:Uncharacterized protein n=1 Tax=Caerostris darwini TaxID=1538125 RepID=A0AAV4TQK6_9ARAC|nr:hypothetical protein CDAR_57271 [Caerostris darwini]
MSRATSEFLGILFTHLHVSFFAVWQYNIFRVILNFEEISHEACNEKPESGEKCPVPNVRIHDTVTFISQYGDTTGGLAAKPGGIFCFLPPPVNAKSFGGGGDGG